MGTIEIIQGFANMILQLFSDLENAILESWNNPYIRKWWIATIIIWSINSVIWFNPLDMIKDGFQKFKDKIH